MFQDQLTKDQLPKVKKIEHILALTDFLNLKSSKIMSNYPDYSFVGQEISEESKNKLSKLITKYKKEESFSVEEIEELSYSIYFLLKSPPKSFDILFYNSSKEFKSVSKMLESSLFQYGLENILKRVEKDQSKLDKFKSFFRKLLTSKKWSYLSFLTVASNNPLVFLNESKFKTIPNEILEEIIFKGPNSKHFELEKYLLRHELRERYNAFVKLYKPVPYILGTIYFLYFFNENIDIENFEDSKILEKMSKIFLQFSQKMITEADENLDSYDILEMKERLFKVTLENFKKKFKRQPTKDESNEIRKAFGLN